MELCVGIHTGKVR